MIHALLNQLFPPTCLSCLQVSLDYLCADCLAKIQKNLIPNHFFISNFGELVFGYSHYAGTSGLIIRALKYGKKTPGAIVIARLLAPLIQTLIQPDLMIPVPISWQKKWSRGFNQCTLIGEEINKITHVPLDDTILTRRFAFSEKDQVKLSSHARKNNLEHAFTAKKTTKYPAHATVVLLDDVATTGKTIHACQKALHDVYPDWNIKPLVFAHN